MTLFSGCLKLSVASKIWDCILLEGEIYAIKVALGIL